MKNYYSASGDITSGPITTTTGNMSSTRDNIQTQHNAVSGKTGESHLRACTALDQKTLTIPQSRRTFMELEQAHLKYAQTRMNTLILQLWLQPINEYLVTIKQKWWTKAHVNVNTTPSLTLNNAALATKNRTCSNMSCAISLAKKSTTLQPRV